MTECLFITFDTHIDIPWPERTSDGFPAWEGPKENDIWALDTQRRFSFPKARQGALNAACLAAYIPQSFLSLEGYQSAWRRACAMLQTIHDSVTAVSGDESGIYLCRTADDIRSAIQHGHIAVLPVVENGYAVGEDPTQVSVLARKYGVRYITLTHNGHNQLADSAIARGESAQKHGGLSALGRDVISEMNRYGVVVDVSHASKDSMMQAVEYSQTPVIASHSCIRALCDHPRNLDDKQLDLLRATGGVVQVTAMGAFLKKGGGGTLNDMMEHILYAARRIGVEHVGLSSDFDGGGGIKGWQDASQTAQVVDALKQVGFDESEQRAICGENMIRILEEADKAIIR